jgi:hypothetical protein
VAAAICIAATAGRHKLWCVCGCVLLASNGWHVKLRSTRLAQLLLLLLLLLVVVVVGVVLFRVRPR